MLISTNEFYNFKPFLVALTLAGVPKVNGKENLLASLSHMLHAFPLNGIQFGMVMEQLELNILVLL